MFASFGDIRAAWIEAVRLRTLPLAASGSFVAAGIAVARGAFKVHVFLLMLLVSILLQVIANFADDYGDLSHGLDDETRIGPKRGMQRGLITPAQMRRALIALSLVTLCAGIALIYTSLHRTAPYALIPFLLLGLIAIAAAILYTVGPKPYGYIGLGDIVSFIFFGLVSVIGGVFLYTHQIDPCAVIAGIALGLPVAAVMNVNNMRDSQADAAKGKHTVANSLYAAGVRSGIARANGKTPQEIAAMAFVLERGPHINAQQADAELARKGEAFVQHMTSPETVGTLTGEAYMRSYHFLLGATSLALFVISVFALRGFGLHGWIGAVIALAASTPLMRAIQGACQTRDHAALDTFMAPTSLGTVALALAVSVVFAVA